ncbi:hypothetical protein [Nostoc sp.]|uniref:hypothetical protein n=1 Tax=Nostoc sp. TaxID=1180 RepID=UPI002FFBD05B
MSLNQCIAVTFTNTLCHFIRANAPINPLVKSSLFCIYEAIATTYLLISDYSVVIITSDALITAIAP